MIEGALALWYLLTAASIAFMSIAFMVYDLATNTPLETPFPLWVMERRHCASRS